MDNALADTEMILDELDYQVFHEGDGLSIPLNGGSHEIRILARNDSVFFDCRAATIRQFRPENLNMVFVAMLAANRSIRPIAFSLDPEPMGSDNILDIPIILTTAVPASALKIPSRIDRIREIMDAFKKGVERANDILSEYKA